MTPIIDNPDSEFFISMLEDFFETQESVELAYLFGSAAKGARGATSDIDIAVYLSEKNSKLERNQKRLELIAGLTTLLKSDRVDLIIMNDAPPVLNFEVIKANVPVFIRDRDLKLDVEQRIMSRYLDRKYHEDFLNRSFLKRIMKRGLA